MCSFLILVINFCFSFYQALPFAIIIKKLIIYYKTKSLIMKRPHLVHFLAIVTDESINIKASITLKENLMAQNLDLDIPTPKFPIQALRLLNAYQFTMKIVGMAKDQREIYKKSFESDSFGNFNFKIPIMEMASLISPFITISNADNKDNFFICNCFVSSGCESTNFKSCATNI